MTVFQRTAILGAFAILFSACAADQMPNAARSCYLIDVDDSQRRGLSTYFDRFAIAHGLKPDTSSPSAYVYRKASAGVLIALHPFMGDVGASADLFADRNDCLICQAFDKFLRDEVARDYKVVPCSDVEGFRPTELHNVDLRQEPP